MNQFQNNGSILSYYEVICDVPSKLSRKNSIALSSFNEISGQVFPFWKFSKCCHPRIPVPPMHLHSSILSTMLCFIKIEPNLNPSKIEWSDFEEIHPVRIHNKRAWKSKWWWRTTFKSSHNKFKVCEAAMEFCNYASEERGWWLSISLGVLSTVKGIANIYGRGREF